MDTAETTFNENVYLAANPDVAAAVARGDFPSGWSHYEANGRFEDRRGLLPTDFSEEAYLMRNPSVAEAIASGGVTSAALHYSTVGRALGLSYRRRGDNRRSLLDSLWHGQDPFSGFPLHTYAVDKQGWNSEHPYLARAIEELRPRTVLEIGVWKGGSTITMARRMRELNLDAAVLAVDTWLGAADHWLRADLFSDLGFENGYPKLYHRFAANIVAEELVDYVVPLPLDSVNAAAVIREAGIVPEVIHIDAGHDYASVIADLRVWWEQLADGGVLIADDYYPGGEGWPGVLKAVDEFFKSSLFHSFEHQGGKAYVRKPIRAT